MVDEEKKTKRLFEKISEGNRSDSLVISRLPKELKEFIVSFSKEHCCGDYGWALSLLLGPVSEFVHSFKLHLDDHEVRISALEEKGKDTGKDEPSERKKEMKRFL